MEVPPKVLEIAEGIKTMRIRGAGRIARAAAEALKIAALEYKGPMNEQSFRKYMARIADLIISTRPTAVSLPNAVLYVMYRLMTARGSVKELIETVVNTADRFIQESLEAVKKIGEIGARRIKDDAVVLTHCHSTASVSVIVTAYKMGKIRKVYSTETRPFYQGRITMRHLLEAGVPATQIPDSAVRYIMHEVDQVVVGADTIASNGAVVNKIGTSQVALAAHEARVRVFVAAETYKFSPATVIGELVPIEFRPPTEIVSEEWIKKHPNIEVLNPSFDVTPPEYIDAIITERGVIPPQAAILVLMDRFGWALSKIKQGEFARLKFEETIEE
ncbi:ribose 1,5-bisphosphate isomerase [Desulfurococcaceae archaeon MEX13E-LK6-19]|nr:ribose 1,5-bisphosphate isomerase [Desulfurococcaceae archaeon MEX13E-LK6-19]